MKRVIAGVIVTGVLFSGCKQIAPKVQEAATQIQAGILTENELSGIKDPLVRKHLVAQANTRSYRTTSKSSGMGEGETITEVQISGTQARIHTLTKAGGNPSQEMIIISDTTYIKDFSDGKWWKQIASAAKEEKQESTIQLPNLEEMKAEFTKKQSTAQYKSLGTEACGTLTCYKYEEVDSDNPEAVRTFWFDNKDFLLRKEENKFGEFTSTNEYAYGDIKIEAPSPTKEVPQGKNVFEMMLP